MAEKLCLHGRVSLVWLGRSIMNGVSGRKESLDTAMGSKVNGHSSSALGMDMIISMAYLLVLGGLIGLLGGNPLLVISFLGLE